jgi:hypothetical protein
MADPWRLRLRPLRGPTAWLLVAGAFALACDPNAPHYVDGTAPLEVAVMTDAMGQPVTEAHTTLTLKFRPPTSSESEDLARDSTARGYAVPWLSDDDVHLELLYTVQNLSDTPAVFKLAIDGASELVRYDEDAVASAFDAANEDPVLLGLMTAVPAKPVPAHGTYQGVLREDDFSEAALDLDAMGRWMGNFVGLIINRSEVNPIGLEMVPKTLVRPALFEVTVRFVSAAHMTCAFSVRVRDDRGRLLTGDGPAFMPMPTTFAPTVMMN